MEFEAHDNLDIDIDERPRVMEYAEGKIDPQTGEQIKNSLMEAADRDVKEDEDEPELTPLEKEQKLRWAVTRQPLLREIMYKIMDLCRTETELHDLEDAVDGFPEYAIIRQSALSIADILVKNHGLEVIERDGEGNVVLPEQKEGLTEDEVDDLVATINYRTTSFGEDYVRANRPAVRLEQMLNLNPERRETYAEVLQFLDEEPRTYDQVKNLLAGRPILEVVLDGRPITMQPSVFLDKLEYAGAIVWRDGWTLTPAGKTFLSEICAQ